MRFEEALKLMRAGKRICLPHWRGYYIHLNGPLLMYGGSVVLVPTENDFQNWIAADNFQVWEESSP